MANRIEEAPDGSTKYRGNLKDSLKWIAMAFGGGGSSAGASEGASQAANAALAPAGEAAASTAAQTVASNALAPSAAETSLVGAEKVANSAIAPSSSAPSSSTFGSSVKKGLDNFKEGFDTVKGMTSGPYQQHNYMLAPENRTPQNEQPQERRFNDLMAYLTSQQR